MKTDKISRKNSVRSSSEALMRASLKFGGKEEKQKKKKRRKRDGSRRDRFGTLIQKGGEKSHKVTFRDKSRNKKPLVDVKEVESFKEYNLYGFHPTEGGETQEKTFKCNCAIF
jgi:hypothetical protein